MKKEEKADLLMKKILKPGVKLEAKILDYNSPEIKASLERVAKHRKRILASKNVDWDKLSRMYITI
jgi:hypothetical protein